MKKSILTNPRFFIFLFALWPITGCTHQEVVNSPCATLNSIVQIKPNADLSVNFGNDAIQAAIDAVKGHVSIPGKVSVTSLTNAGKEAALSTAKANGKNPTTADVAALERYLGDEVVPTIKQNPTCIFTVAASARPYVGVEKVALHGSTDTKSPHVWIRNTGQREVTCHTVLRYFLDKKEVGSGFADVNLVPAQLRTVSLKDSKLPIPDILSGKVGLVFIVEISYPLENRGSPVAIKEIWEFDHTANQFFLAHPGS